MNREELQKNTLEEVKKQKDKIFIINWATGCGKTKVAIDIANYFIFNTSSRVLLVCAESAHKENWKKELSKFNLSKCSLTVECYASLKNYKNTEWDIVIFDEVHHIQSEKRLEILQTMDINYIIGLSATINSNILYSIKNTCGNYYISTVSLNDAISLGILPTPEIFVIPIKLDDATINCEIVEEWGKGNKVEIKCSFDDRWKYLKNRKSFPNTKLVIRCTQLQKYNYIENKYKYFQEVYWVNPNNINKFKWLKMGNQRKSFLGECKESYLMQLLETIKTKRFICFCSSIEQAERLGGHNAIHSKKKKVDEIIQAFNNKSINSLFAVGMLQEGQNLEDIEIGIIAQLDGQQGIFTQKFGRTLRAQSPKQYILYVEGTHDNTYLYKVLSTIDNKYIKYLK